jgi:hypothetical protein
VKGWLASDGEARFAWTGLREAARSVGGGAERLGLSRYGNTQQHSQKKDAVQAGVARQRLTFKRPTEAGVDARCRCRTRGRQAREAFGMAAKGERRLSRNHQRHPFMDGDARA